MSPLVLLAALLAVQDPIVFRTAESPDPVLLPSVALEEKEIGILVGASPEAAEVMSASGFSAPPFVRGKIAVVLDPKASAPSGTETLIWVTMLPREQAAAVLRETPGIRICIVSGRGGGDATPLKIGESWMVQAPGSSGLWGRLELLGGVLTHRLEPPAGKFSDVVAAARRAKSYPVDLIESLKAGEKVGTGTAPPPPTPECANRGCKLRILGIAERPSYGARSPAAGKRLLVLDAELENIIPLTLVQSKQIPTIYRIKELGDHLYVVVNGTRVARLYADASTLPGHLTTTNVNLERLGARMRGNLVFEIPAGDAKTLDLRYYDFAHGHMSLMIKPGAALEAKPILPLQQNEAVEVGVFRVERLRQYAGKPAPDGMTFFNVDLRARSRLFTEADATAYDPKAKPGDKLQIGTVADWTDLRKHLNVLVDGERSVGPNDLPELDEAPRFIPDLLSGGTVVFLVPEKSASLELRCDFPNARLPSGRVVHPAALQFLLEGKRPEAAAAGPALLEIDDDIFKLAILGQRAVAELRGVKAPAGTKFLVLDMTVKGNGTAGEQFQTAEQLRYASEKGAQINPHDASYDGPAAAAKLLLVPKGESRRFELVFAIPEGDTRPRLAYRGVTKAQVLTLPALEGVAAPATPKTPEPVPGKILCPKCKAEAAPNAKFCDECGTKLTPK
jgi:hypothetical protein